MLIIYEKEGLIADRLVIFPGKTVSKEFFESLIEEYKSLGYRVSFEEKNDCYILKVNIEEKKCCYILKVVTKYFIIIGCKTDFIQWLKLLAKV